MREMDLRGGKIQKGGLWRYQLLSRDMKSVVNKTSTYLKTDEDCRALVRLVKGDGKDTPIAVFTQVCIVILA